MTSIAILKFKIIHEHELNGLTAYQLALRLKVPLALVLKILVERESERESIYKEIKTKMRAKKKDIHPYLIGIARKK